ncbi:MAG: hypothetical protein ACI97B_004527 [Verrucomicrobiales bacterium]
MYEDSGVSGSYSPAFAFLDVIKHPPVLDLLPRVTEVIDRHGLKRLQSSDLDTWLSMDANAPTTLAGPPFRHFDARFYWED